MDATNEAPAYGGRGRIGLIVPPANVTIEPEIQSVLPPGVSLHSTRLPGRVSEDTSIGLSERFLGYNRALPDVANSFGGAKLSALCLGVTGSCYIVGPDGEEALLSDMKAGGTLCVTTAARALSELISSLGGRKIGLVVPYPDWLTKAAIEYWHASGFDVVRTLTLSGVVSIYDVRTSKVTTAAEQMKGTDIDVLVLSGTGVPTVPAVEQLADKLGMPVISSNLSLAWWALRALEIETCEIQSAALLGLRRRIGEAAAGA